MENNMTFAQKLRRVTISMLVLILIEAIVGIVCYKLGILKWFFIFWGACFVIEIIGFSISDYRDRKAELSN